MNLGLISVLTAVKHSLTMKYSIIFLAVIFTLGRCAEAPYPIESNLISSYPNSPHGHNVYASTKWAAEPHADPDAFSVQSGYEGYLVPAEEELPSFGLIDLLKTAGLVTLLKPLSKIGIKLAFKFGIWALGFAGLFLLGSLFTSTICAVTPLCTISFLGFRGFSRESMRSLISQEKLNSAAQFVSEAVKKYKEINNDSKKKENRE